jgi:hypothetical protein
MGIDGDHIDGKVAGADSSNDPMLVEDFRRIAVPGEKYDELFAVPAGSIVTERIEGDLGSRVIAPEGCQDAQERSKEPESTVDLDDVHGCRSGPWINAGG